MLFKRALVAVLLVPCAAFAQMGNPPPVVDRITLPSPVQSSATALITCDAADDGNVMTMRLTVSGGTLPSGGLTEVVAITPGPAVSGSLTWTTPVAGSYTVTCDVTDDGGMFGGSASGTLSVPVSVQDVVGSPPVIDLLAAADPTLLLGGTTRVVAAAHDPDNDALTFTWSATSGTLTPAGDSATWVAPQVGGAYSVSLLVRDLNGLTATRSVQVQVTTDRYAGALTTRLTAPRRLALAPSGDVYVVDASSGVLSLMTQKGQLKNVFSLPARALSVAACWGKLLVATERGHVLALDPASGQQTGVLVSGVAWPSGMACDASRGLLYIAERRADRVRAVWSDGTTAFAHVGAGADSLRAPVDVAVDAATRRVWVLLDGYEVGTTRQAHAFTLDGNYAMSLAPFGGGQGKVTRGAGIAVGSSGRLYVTDVFQARVQVFDAAGASIGELGSFGTAPGQLQQPSGLAATAWGAVLVANTGAGRLELFGSGSAPECPGDTDCDGLPDAWELANGLNPNDPRDAFADPDVDGLTNLQELALGTNPRRADTDGDGYTDGEEFASGLNPLDPLDHRATLFAQGVSSDPGMIELSSNINGRGACSVAWKQNAGPTVQLRNAATTNPWFVARAAGSYVLEGTPTCDGLAGAPTEVTVEVRQVAPRAEPGRVMTVAQGDAVQLDARSSWDANDEVLSLSWDQTLGPPRLARTGDATPWVRLYQPGLYVFALTADDGVGNSSMAEVPVLVVDPTRPAPTAMVTTPVHGEVGALASFSAANSTGHGVLAFAWSQTTGPAVTLDLTDPSSPSFVPAVTGHYQFEVKVLQGSLASPPERVDVYIGQPGVGLPIARVPALLTGPVGQPLTLDGTASTPAVTGATLAYVWRQVSGPAAGLTRADEARANVVPFRAGTFLFELTVLEGDTSSMPAWVRVETDVAGLVRPVAVADAAPVTTVGSEVLLDGNGSTGTGALTYRWTQVAGPWVAVTDARAPLATFTPRAPGLYSFELEVNDGAVRSAPTTVGVLVFPAAGQGGRP